MTKSMILVATRLFAYTNAASTKQMRSNLMRPASDTHTPEQPDYRIIYPDDEDSDLFEIDPSEFAESFAWYGEDDLCSATMISAQVAITAAHCIYEGWDLLNPLYMDGSSIDVVLTDSAGGDPFETTIREIRVNECWLENKY